MSMWELLNVTDNDKPTQLDKFKEAARQLEADEDEARWDDRLRKIAKAKPKLADVNPPSASSE
jgi:hypothetical protein